jgi:predicted ATPase
VPLPNCYQPRLCERTFAIARARSKILGAAHSDKSGTPLEKSGGVNKAHGLLAPIYGWFTEGFLTRDLQNAKNLLDELQ